MEPSIESLQTGIKALEELRDHYIKLQKGEGSFLLLCPLCRTMPFKDRCDKCYWLKYKGIDCKEAVKPYHPSRSLYCMRNGYYFEGDTPHGPKRSITKFKYHKRWVSDRIKDLQLWIEMEKGELEKLK